MGRPTCRQLVAENRRLRRRVGGEDRRIARLEARVEQLQAQVRRLTAQVERALRARKRQAAPLAEGPPRDPAVPPGCKAGGDYGTPARRRTPRRQPDETHAAALPGQCPDCDAPLVEDRRDYRSSQRVRRR